MDFLKKHWEKLLLTLALVALIAMGVWLMMKIDSIQQDVNQIPLRPRPKGEVLAPVERGPYTNAIARLQNPALVQIGETDPFGTAIRDEPQPEPPRPEPTNDVAKITLVGVRRIPFKMLFKAYSWNGTSANTFQLDFAFRPLTMIVLKIGDEVANREERTGFIVTNFERKIARVNDPSVGMTDKDLSILTIQRPNEDPIKLTLGKIAEEREPVAKVACDPGWPAKPVTYQVRRGQQFECGGTTYIVVDIAARQMIIKNANKPEEKPKTIELSTSPEPTSP